MDRNPWLDDTFNVRLHDIKKRVLDEHKKSKAPELKWFTPHGEEHYKNVEMRLMQLLPECNDLSVNEKFFLLTSAWIHDLGMIKGILDGDEQLDSYEIRDKHHIRSEQYIVKNHEFLDIEETEKEAFAMLARYHRRRELITQCEESMTLPYHGNIRIQLLAAYLRLADALHIDQTRAPFQQYAIVLAYNIPINSKLHWLRSMFVLGISINLKNKEIVVQLKYPNDIKEWDQDERVLNSTLDSIYDSIVQDLEEELATVKEILIKGGQSYILSIRKEIVKVRFDKSFKRDIKTVLNYYYLFDNPSSSALCRLVIESIRGIRDAHNGNIRESISTISDFLNEIKKKILDTRTCHTGLSDLVKSVEEHVKKQGVEGLDKKLAKDEKKLNNERNGVRENAREFFDIFQKKNPKKLAQNNKVNILLYGYSELVIKSLCGFRDAIIQKKLKDKLNDNIKAHKLNLEHEANNNFRIFICEGQPKNKTTWGGKYLYHDGFRYAISLAERNFEYIYMIADATAGSLIARANNSSFPPIDFIMVGANGFTEKEFKHSAGHSTIAALKFLPNNKKDYPKLILSIINSKHNESEDKKEDNNKNDLNNADDRETVPIDGWTFKTPFNGEPTRNNIFVTQDPKYKKDMDNFKNAIAIYNPREDAIPIDWVDIVISENVWLKNTGKESWGGRYIVEQKQSSSEPYCSLNSYRKILFYRNKKRQITLRHSIQQSRLVARN